MSKNTDPQLLARLRAAGVFDALLGGVRHLLVGCSGGGDSMCLLDLLASLAGEQRELADGRSLRLTVAHLNHGLRGAQSDAEAERVATVADGYGLPLVIETASLGDPTAALESRCRRARHDFFLRTCDRLEADAVALAHTLDDRAETVLMNLARGAGRRGLAGMRARSAVGRLTLVRPLLGLRRHELREHLQCRGIGWHEDPMNADLRFTRARLRHQVLPGLADAVPGTVENIVRAAEILEADEAWIDDLVASRMDAMLQAEPSPGGLRLDVLALCREPRGLQSRLLRMAIGRVRGDLQGIRREHVDALIDRVLAGEEGARDLPGVRAAIAGSSLRLLPLQDRVLRRDSAAGFGS